MARYALAGRTVAITGGTGGFALALAPALRARGANVALLDLDPDLASEVAAGLGGLRSARGWQADVRDLDGLGRVMTEVVDHFGRLDVVVANAGIGEMASLLADGDPERWLRTVDVNLNGVYRTFRAAQPHVVETRGYMLATCSMAAFIHAPLMNAYAATKAAVWALCDTWRMEVRHLGVAVGSLHPTFFDTPLMDAVHADPAGYRLWNGNTGGLWKSVDIGVVVSEAIRGIERRAAHIVAPRSLWPVALAPAIGQAVADRFGYPRRAIEEAIALVQPHTDASAPSSPPAH